MSKLYFITDLDRTIIHSKNKGYKCVEFMEDREITYMTEKGYDEFQELLKNEDFKFIPCTMRSLHQTLRVDFIREYNPEIMICSNGAQIYINGELDKEWNKYMRSMVDYYDLFNQIRYLEVIRLDFINEIKIEEIRNIEDFYITVKAETIEDATKYFEIIYDKFSDTIKVIQIERKIFIMSTMVDKLWAVDYIIQKYKMDNVITAGDSEVDRYFTKRGKSILPKHCNFKHDKSTTTKREGIHSSEDIFKFLRKRLR